MKLFTAFIQYLTNLIKSVLSALLGVNEIMFLLGLGALFNGLQHQFSLHIAFIVCGSLLIVVSIGGIVFGAKAGSK